MAASSRPSAACREPITLVESGPVGGCIGARVLRQRAYGIDNLVAFDMGGNDLEMRP